LRKLRAIDFSITSIRGTGLAHLKDCPELLDLNLKNTRVDDEGMQGLKGWSHLRTLTLPAAISDAGLEHLEGLTSLDKLELNECNRITGKSLARLKTAAPNLRILSLSKTGLGNDTVGVLSKLTQVHEVFLGGTAVTAEAWPELKKLAHLRVLGLPQHPSITYEKLQELRKALPKTWVLQ
jgi:hypothetical protein